MSEISEKAIKLIKDLRRDISIDIMFTPEKNAEDDSLKALVDYIAELESTLSANNELLIPALKKRESEIVELSNKAISKLNKRIAELEGEIAKMKKYFHKPAHGTCCTCQKCGHTYDECRCDFDEALDDLDKANARIAELEVAQVKAKNEIYQLNRRITELLEVQE